MCGPHETVSSYSISKAAGPDKRDGAMGRTSDTHDIFDSFFELSKSLGHSFLIWQEVLKRRNRK